MQTNNQISFSNAKRTVEHTTIYCYRKETVTYRFFIKDISEFHFRTHSLLLQYGRRNPCHNTKALPGTQIMHVLSSEPHDHFFQETIRLESSRLVPTDLHNYKPL